MPKKVEKALVSQPAVPAGIRLVASQLRSTNLERDLTADSFPEIHVGARIVDCLERLTASLADPTRTRAWSLTGPYGSGKSTLASLIATLVGPVSERYHSALRQVRAEYPRLADAAEEWRSGLDAHYGPGAAEHGMLVAAVSARQEPLAVTIRRALHSTAASRWPGEMPSAVNKALRAFNAPDSGSSDILQAVEALSEHAPICLMIDEFGKTLEYLARRGEEASRARRR